MPSLLTACLPGTFGEDCGQICQCAGATQECHPVTGACVCAPGFHGPTCQLGESALGSSSPSSPSQVAARGCGESTVPVPGVPAVSVRSCHPRRGGRCWADRWRNLSSGSSQLAGAASQHRFSWVVFPGSLPWSPLSSLVWLRSGFFLFLTIARLLRLGSRLCPGKCFLAASSKPVPVRSEALTSAVPLND